MRYWWVNQNQTHKHELAGGYLWSPKSNKNDSKNPFYQFMKEVAPGDIVFSFVDTRTPAIGIVSSYCYESPKPLEFEGVGMNWNDIGWRVRVTFNRLTNQIRPKDHMHVLQQTLPARYSPLQASGNGNQGVYLTEVPDVMAQVLIGLIGSEAVNIARTQENAQPFIRPAQETADLEMWERHIEETIEEDVAIPRNRPAIVDRCEKRAGAFQAARHAHRIELPNHEGGESRAPAGQPL
jgi:putative restriction endonuclease